MTAENVSSQSLVRPQPEVNGQRFIPADWVMLAGAALMVLTFLYIPWVLRGDDSFTAQTLLTAPPRNMQNNASGVALIVVSGGIGLLGWLIAVRWPRNRRGAAGFAFVGGLIGLGYYLLFVINNSANLEAMLEPVSLGFWVALVAAGALVIQFFIPRPLYPDEKSPAGWFFIMPGVVWVLFFTLFPLLHSFTLSFTNLRLGRDAEFIGFENFARILSDQRVEETIVTTLFLAVFGVIFTLFLGTFIAWLFNRTLPGLRIFRTVMTIPLFAAPIALGFLGKVMFNQENGPINYMLASFGFQPVPWFTDPVAARVAVMIVDTWQWTPFVFIVVLAAMQSISDELYEAARIDTSNGWDLFRFITFPLIAPALGTVGILRLVETLKILDIPLAMTDGGPGTATQTYSYYTYITGLGRSFNLGYGSALAFGLVIVAIIITSIYFWRVRERFA
ncbi:MAG: sugar ABC transporter permease [Chloroflexi bacterium]|nr:sugar ABC transporter permease [Chloroflexota bacterium]